MKKSGTKVLTVLKRETLSKKEIYVVGTFSGKIGGAVVKNIELANTLRNLKYKVIKIDFGRRIHRGVGYSNLGFTASQLTKLLKNLYPLHMLFYQIRKQMKISKTLM